eukprot:scaffold732_cov60-Phaeocystis_antarctica.AAC.14
MSRSSKLVDAHTSSVICSAPPRPTRPRHGAPCLISDLTAASVTSWQYPSSRNSSLENMRASVSTPESSMSVPHSSKQAQRCDGREVRIPAQVEIVDRGACGEHRLNSLGRNLLAGSQAKRSESWLASRELVEPSIRDRRALEVESLQATAPGRDRAQHVVANLVAFRGLVGVTNIAHQSKVYKRFHGRCQRDQPCRDQGRTPHIILEVELQARET